MSANKAKALVPRPQIFTFGNEVGFDGVIVACVQQLSTQGNAFIGLTFTKAGESFCRDFGVKGAFLRMLAQMGVTAPYMQQWLPIIFKDEKIMCDIKCPQVIKWKDRSGKERFKTVSKVTKVTVAELGRLDINKYGYICQIDGDAYTTVANLLLDQFIKNSSNPGSLPNWVSDEFMSLYVKPGRSRKDRARKVAKK